LTNGAGAWLGARLLERAQNQLSKRWIGKLALELPLMNVVYLLIPLIWLNGLAAGRNAFHNNLALLPGLCGCLIISAVYVRLELPTASRSNLVIFSATGWFLISSLPRIAEYPAIVAYGIVLVALATRSLVRLPWFGEADHRRFEIPVLKRVWPIYVAYLILLSLGGPLPLGYRNWLWVWGLCDLSGGQSIVPVWWLMEYFAGFTLLGYIVAESHGRRDITVRTSILLSCFWCGLAATLLEICRGFHPRFAASFLQGLFGFTGSLYGSVIYWFQLSSIQRLLGHASTRPDPVLLE
jgi:hypothetical protein